MTGEAGRGWGRQCQRGQTAPRRRRALSSVGRAQGQGQAPEHGGVSRGQASERSGQVRVMLSDLLFKKLTLAAGWKRSLLGLTTDPLSAKLIAWGPWQWAEGGVICGREVLRSGTGAAGAALPRGGHGPGPVCGGAAGLAPRLWPMLTRGCCFCHKKLFLLLSHFTPDCHLLGARAHTLSHQPRETCSPPMSHERHSPSVTVLE